MAAKFMSAVASSVGTGEVGVPMKTIFTPDSIST
jgi:hypothetical protein